MISENDVNILDLPTIQIDFEGEFLASCGLPNQIELLDLCHEYFIDWFTQRYSLQEFAQKYANKHISLWTTQAVELPTSMDNHPFFAFIIRFDALDDSYVLVQCKLMSRDKVH
ncbi:hemophilus-specific protein [Lonepinella koalarum]|uniref:hemophilus-specific protein n=1 Tax=Lonepinella koalarum TaxID=53417 RepID=UPI0011E4A1AD|nr:hemophilus-specific protein [Lonepinella koalarum]TYG35303.1 hemophilus-specific protein [Lonepinella koalarum]